MDGMHEPRRLLDAENIIIPFLRARFDGDPTHDKITWLIQTEDHIESRPTPTDSDGGFGVQMGVIRRTYMIALFNITGVMFNHKEQIPDHFLKDQDRIQMWAEKSHGRFIKGLRDQMQDFIMDVRKSTDDLDALSAEI